MALSRRNMLLGMVVLVVGAGVIGASGAFTSVEAQRTMSISTSDDSAALLSLDAIESSTIASTEAEDGDDDTQVLTIDRQKLNEDAITTFDAAFSVSVDNSAPNDVGVYIDKSSGNLGAVDFIETSGDTTIKGSDKALTLSPGDDAVDIKVEVDLTGENDTGDLPNGDITIVADTDQAA
jgi:threonine dehydrogenase-like Zn-dependent dehydrogenase